MSPANSPGDDLDGAEANGASTTGTEPPTAVEVDGVELSFDDGGVLDGVDASVDSGELVGLVGPNGAGKTTLLRTISGALTPDTGAVRVAGGPEQGLDDVQTLSSAASSRRIAVVPQTTTLSFSFTVRQLVEMGRHPHRSRFQPPSREDSELVDDALEHTRTVQFAERSIEDVSGGERQRILLARAIAQDAPILLLDEPTANLDLHHAVETMSLVRDLVDEDTAALAAIHDLELAARFCDRILVLAGGEIVAAGAPETVLETGVLEAAFDARIAVEPSPIDGGVTVRAMAEPEIDRRVHVVGGGEPAAAAIGRLGEAGADCSLGPVPEGDRAVSTVEGFEGESVTVPRFGSVDSATRERASQLAAAADVVVLAADRVGPRDEPWLDCCGSTDAAPVVVLESTEIETEFTDTTNSAASLLDRARRTDVDSLPGTVEAVAARSTATGDEPVGSDRLADATLADGGTDATSAADGVGDRDDAS